MWRMIPIVPKGSNSGVRKDFWGVLVFLLDSALEMNVHLVRDDSESKGSSQTEPFIFIFICTKCTLTRTIKKATREQ